MIVAIVRETDGRIVRVTSVDGAAMVEMELQPGHHAMALSDMPPPYAKVVDGQVQEIARPTPPTEEPDPNAVPAAVGRMQAELALLDAGLLADVESAVAASPERVQRAWHRSTQLRRDSDMVADLATAIGITDAQLDDLFIAAARIHP
jgi:hypothetical protein